VDPKSGVTVAARSPARDAAFAAFYRRELERQARRAFLLLGSNDAADDVVHDAFVAVYLRWDSIEAPGPYLNRVVLNGCRDVGRRRARGERAIARLGAGGGAGGGEREGAGGHDGTEVLDDVLAILPFNQRAAVVLRYYAQLSIDEIADALGCRRGSVGPWISRALKSMRKVL
jgi:RNA polymerase sigma factor (sigma-70 family)